MKIMFVCTGNICRSAMADWLLKERLKENKQDIQVYSCGIQAYTGESATNYSIQTLKKHGIDGKKHRATNVKDSCIKECDLILCATINHKMALIRMYPEKQDKIYTMKEYAFPEEKEDLDIADPWGYDLQTYENCFIQIEKCVTEIIERIKNNKQVFVKNG